MSGGCSQEFCVPDSLEPLGLQKWPTSPYWKIAPPPCLRIIQRPRMRQFPSETRRAPHSGSGPTLSQQPDRQQRSNPRTPSGHVLSLLRKQKGEHQAAASWNALHDSTLKTRPYPSPRVMYVKPSCSFHAENERMLYFPSNLPLPSKNNKQ